MHSADFEEPADFAALLRRPLDQLDQMGIHRPPHLTLQQFMQRLAAHRVASKHTVSAYLVLYQEVRYAARDLDADVMHQIVQRLMHEFSAMATWSQAERDELVRQMAEDDHPADSPADASDMEPPYIPPGHDKPRANGTSKSWRWRLGFAALLVWSIVMMLVGYWQSDQIALMMLQFRSGRSDPGVVLDQASARELGKIRRRAIRQPLDERAWTEYQVLAEMLQQEEELLVIYTYRVSRQPDDAGILNNFAWLLATARKEELRDPERALPMAEKAYALLPEPHIADTLAEALFLNGEIQRAIELEEKAFAEAKGDKSHFENQLKRFRAALRQPASPARE